MKDEGVSEKTKKLSTESYKGVRDFYPEDMAIQKHIFAVMRKTVEKFGFVELRAIRLMPKLRKRPWDLRIMCHGSIGAARLRW